MKMHPKFISILNVIGKIHCIASLALLIIIWFCVEDLLLFFCFLIPLTVILGFSQVLLSVIKILLKNTFEEQKTIKSITESKNSGEQGDGSIVP